MNGIVVSFTPGSSPKVTDNGYDTLSDTVFQLTPSEYHQTSARLMLVLWLAGEVLMYHKYIYVRVAPPASKRVQTCSVGGGESKTMLCLISARTCSVQANEAQVLCLPSRVVLRFKFSMKKTPVLHQHGCYCPRLMSRIQLCTASLGKDSRPSASGTQYHT